MTSAHSRQDVRIFLKECRTLAQAGFDVALVVSDGRGPETVQGVRIIDAGARAGGRVGRALRTAAKVFRVARRLQADIYHFHDPELLPWGMLLRLLGARVIYDAHEHLPDDILSKHYIARSWRRLIASGAGPCELLAARTMSAVVAATPNILERFARHAALREGVYNFPLEDELLRPTAWEHRRVQACYVGGISINRGVAQLARAAEVCRTRIVLAGPLWDGLRLEEAASLPGWDRIDYRGVLSRGEVAELMGRSRVGLITFLGVPNHVNALPNKLFEYMSAGIPVVASDFPAWKEIVAVTNCGLCVDPNDPSAIAAAVDRLAGDPEFAAYCGKNGAAAVGSRFNWGSQAGKLAQLYGRVLA